MSTIINSSVEDIPICHLTTFLTLIVKRIVRDKIFMENISILRLVRNSIRRYESEEPEILERIIYKQCKECLKEKNHTFSKHCNRCAAIIRHKKNKENNHEKRNKTNN